jgi:hypothetical protein
MVTVAVKVGVTVGVLVIVGVGVTVFVGVTVLVKVGDTLKVGVLVGNGVLGILVKQELSTDEHFTKCCFSSIGYIVPFLFSTILEFNINDRDGQYLTI